MGVERGKKLSGYDGRDLGSEEEDPIVGLGLPRVKSRTPLCGQERGSWLRVENVTVARERPLVRTDVTRVESGRPWVRVEVVTVGSSLPWSGGKASL